VLEEAGRGLEVRLPRGEYRLGAPGWVAPAEQARGDVVFGRDGCILADIRTEESLRPDAVDEVRELRSSGFDVWLLSGDESQRVAQMARASGIPEDHIVAGASPHDKARWVAEHDHGDLLMVGDGLNDALVVERATCGGTPAIDRPFMAARSDFYFVSPGLRPVRRALEAAAAVSRVRNRNLVIAVAYNVLAVSLAYAGLMSPLLCAVLMPASSLSTIAATTMSLRPRSLLWRS
jgi:Cu2+-exporting ATPase